MKIFAQTILLSLIISCGLIQTNEDVFVDKSTPEQLNVDQALINKLIYDLRIEKIKNIHSLLIIKDDKLITEEYFNEFKRDDLHYAASVTKSFASTIIGIAIDKGFFIDDIQTVLNKSVAELFPEYKDIIAKDSLKKELKLKHILNMTAGFDWDEHSFPYTDNRNDCNKINNSEDPMKFLFERKLVHNPGSKFYYNGGLSLSVSYLIQKYTNMSVDKFAEKYLFTALEIKEYRWGAVTNGLIDTDGGLHLKPIDQAKLGYLFLNNGIWNETQIISKEWVQKATNMIVKNNGMPDDGYQWWGGDFGVLNQTYSMYMASGHGGQKVVVIPEFNTIVVITQQVFNNPYGDLNFMAIISNYILPALSNKLNIDKELRLTENQLTNYKGHFELEDGSAFIDFKIEDNFLVGYSSVGQKNTFLPASETIFKTRVLDLLDIYIEFVIDSDGNVEGLNSNLAFEHKFYIKNKNEE